MTTTTLLSLLAVRLVLEQIPTVPVPLNEYQRLTQKEPRSLTVVESVRISGSFQKGLTLSLTGRSLGELPPVTVLLGDLVVLRACSDDALLNRDERGAVVLTPLKPRFAVRCGIDLPASPEWVVKVPGVVDVGGALADGRVEVREVTGGVATLVVLRPAPALPTDTVEAELTPSLIGRYRLTVSPGDTRFRWELAAHNPNRRPVRLPLAPRAGETFEKLETQARFQSAGDGYAVELPPGDTQLFVTGSMSGQRFEPPVDAAAQYVLVDGHPLLRFDVSSAGKRISPAETGLQAQYRAVQALLLGPGQRVEWKATALETLPSTSYSVQALRSSFFVGPDGVLYGRSDIRLDNAGAAELALPMRGAPEFASINGVSVPLTSASQRDLSLALGPGEQQISVRHRARLDTRFGFAAGTLEQPGVGVTSTGASVRLSTGRDWVPLYHRYSGHAWYALPGLGDCLLTLLFAMWAVHLLSSFGLSRRRSLALGALTAVLASSTEAAHWPVVGALAAGSMLWVATWLRSSRLKMVAPSGLVGITMVLGLGCLVMVGGVTLFGDNIRRLTSMSADALAGQDAVLQPGRSSPAATSFGGSEPASYAGVGAAVHVPSGSRDVELYQEMADTRQPTSATVLLVSAAVADGVYLALNLALAALAYLMRRQLLAGIKAQVVRLFAQQPAPALHPAPAT